MLWISCSFTAKRGPEFNIYSFKGICYISQILLYRWRYEEKLEQAQRRERAQNIQQLNKGKGTREYTWMLSWTPAQFQCEKLKVIFTVHRDFYSRKISILLILLSRLEVYWCSIIYCRKTLLHKYKSRLPPSWIAMYVAYCTPPWSLETVAFGQSIVFDPMFIV